MKKILTAIIALALTAGMFSAFGTSFYAEETSEIFQYTVDGTKATIIGCTQKDISDLVIPETINGYRVDAIAENAFKSCSNITTVKILAKIREIPQNLFAGHRSLEKIEFPSTLEIIGEDAFTCCTKLSSVTVPFSVYLIEDGAFSYSGVKELNLPDRPMMIGEDILQNSQLGAKHAFDSAFYIGKHLISSDRTFDYDTFTVEDGTLDIADGAVEGLYFVKKIVLPEGLKIIGRNAFADCPKLTDINMPSSVEYIGSLAFAFTDITDITIPAGTKVIEEGAFAGCGQLSLGVSGKNKLFKTAGRCLIDVSNKKVLFGRTNVTIPSDGSVTSIGMFAFAGMPKMTSLTIPSKITVIPSYMCYGSQNLETVSLPKTITEIGHYAFSGCAKIRKFVIPDSVTDVGVYAFADCTQLRKITFSKKMTYYPEGFLRNCIFITSLTVPENIKQIDESAFEGCGSLRTIKISSDPKVIHHNAFKNTAYYEDENNWDGEVLYIGNHLITGSFSWSLESSGQSYIIKDGTVDIAREAFKDSGFLRNIYVPDSIVFIGDHAFERCSSLETIRLSENVEIIYEGTFDSCYKLKAVNIPSGVKVIDDKVFSHCNELKEITGGENVVFIGKGAFAWSKKLEKVSLGDNLVWIDDYAFEGTDSLKSIVVPKNVQHIGERAFLNEELETLTFEGNLFIDESWNPTKVLPTGKDKLTVYYDPNFAEGFSTPDWYGYKCYPLSKTPCGDANGDGKVDITDAMLVFYHVAKKAPLTDDALAVCDTNDDGNVDITDAMRIFYFVAKKSQSVKG